MKKFKFIPLILLEILIIIVIGWFIYSKILFPNSDTNTTKNANSNTFLVDRIISYSSGFAENSKSNSNSDTVNLDIYQYTDIAIYLRYLSEETHITKLWIHSPNFTLKPKLGDVSMYYQDSSKFGTTTVLSDSPFDKDIEFVVLNDENPDNSIQYNTPVFFADCSTPICLKYLNKVASNYSLKDTNSIFQDGRILQNVVKESNDIKTSFDFKIHIQDNLGNTYSFPIILGLPSKDSYNQLLEQGKFTEKQENLNLEFEQTR